MEDQSIRSCFFSRNQDKVRGRGREGGRKGGKKEQGRERRGEG